MHPSNDLLARNTELDCQAKPGRTTRLTPLPGDVSYFRSGSNINYKGCPGSSPCPEARRSVPVPFLQNHRMLGVGKDLCGSPSSSVLPLGAEPSSLSRAEVELILKPVSGGGQGLRNTCPTASIFFLHRGRCGLGSSMSHKLSAKRISV